jgi:heptosyltransferase-1
MRILLIRTSAMGDVVHALPALTALRRQFPAAHIGWLVEEAMAPLLEGHPDLDELLVVRTRVWKKRPFAVSSLREFAQFVVNVQRFSPEIVIDLMGNMKAGFIAALSLCDRIIGAARADRREPASAVWISEPVELSGEHVVDRTLSLLAPLGVPREQVDFGGDKLFTGESASVEAPEQFYLIHAGAGWANKRYPAEHWGDVAQRLRAATGLAGVVTAGPGESDLAEAARRLSNGALERVETPSIAVLAGLLRRARLVLAGDTVALHLARALGSRVLALMGPTAPDSHGPYGQPEAAVWQQLPCSFCHRRFDTPKPCLDLIPPQTVVERATALLGL